MVGGVGEKVWDRGGGRGGVRFVMGGWGRLGVE